MKPIDTLVTYLGSLSGPTAKAEFAERCGTTAGQMKQVAFGHRRCGEALAINIDRETAGAVRCEELRPDVDFPYLRGTAKQRARGGRGGERQGARR